MSKHYIRIDSNNIIIKGFSDAFEQPSELDICINENGGRHFEINGEINPCLIDIKGRYNYKLVDGKVVERSEDEKVDLDILKQIKIQQLIDRCNEVITKEFYSDADGTKRNYGLDLENQIRIKSMADDIELAQLKGQTVNNVSYYAQGESPCREYTPEQFLKLSDDAKAWVFMNVNKYKDVLKPMVDACKTTDEVNAISFDMEITK